MWFGRSGAYLVQPAAGVRDGRHAHGRAPRARLAIISTASPRARYCPRSACGPGRARSAPSRPRDARTVPAETIRCGRSRHVPWSNVARSIIVWARNEHEFSLYSWPSLLDPRPTARDLGVNRGLHLGSSLETDSMLIEDRRAADNPAPIR